MSSEAVIRVLQRHGFERRDSSGRKKTGSSHHAYIKAKPGGGHWVVIVVVGKKEIPRGTLKSMIDRSGIPVDEFLEGLR